MKKPQDERRKAESACAQPEVQYDLASIAKKSSSSSPNYVVATIQPETCRFVKISQNKKKKDDKEERRTGWKGRNQRREKENGKEKAVSVRVECCLVWNE